MDFCDVDRFTRDGPDFVEAKIATDQELIAEAVVRAVPRLRALILGGGYGRGEGGYRLVDGQAFACNDYDYFVVVDGGRGTVRAATRALNDIADALHRHVGVEVDFAVLTTSSLPRLEFSLMNAELRLGHRVIAGDPRVLEAMAPMPLATLPLAEFSRLLLNRGSLLLMNRLVLASGGPIGVQAREEFARYLDKAVLACADARLAVAGQYDLRYGLRRERLGELPGFDDPAFMRRYDNALVARFGPSPVLVPVGMEGQALDAVVGDWLDALAVLEGARLGRLPTWSGYASPRISKGQSRPGLTGLLRNLIVTVRDFGVAELAGNPAWSCRYPRERLLSVLPGLLTPSTEVPAREVVAALSVRGEEDACVMQRFLSLWHRYG